jgi:predicted alpha/beta hydrolase family esterase
MPSLTNTTVLVLPGWHNSGPAHWQTRWQQEYGWQRVEQHDWARPLRGDWTARLEEVIVDTPADQPIVLVAHSLGCILVAHWAACSRHCQRVAAALLVAPGDVERPDASPVLQNWRPIACQRLPFRSILVGSEDDPYCSLPRAQTLAQHWGSQFENVGRLGHINNESLGGALGDWPQGKIWLQQTLQWAHAIGARLKSPPA